MREATSPSFRSPMLRLPKDFRGDFSELQSKNSVLQLLKCNFSLQKCQL
jgi:hypothetical protein